MNSVVNFDVAPNKVSKLLVCFAVGRPAQGGAPAELEPQPTIKSVAPSKTRDQRTRAKYIRTLRLRITPTAVTGDAKRGSPQSVRKGLLAGADAARLACARGRLTLLVVAPGGAVSEGAIWPEHAPLWHRGTRFGLAVARTGQQTGQRGTHCARCSSKSRAHFSLISRLRHYRSPVSDSRPSRSKRTARERTMKLRAIGQCQLNGCCVGEREISLRHLLFGAEVGRHRTERGEIRIVVLDANVGHLTRRRVDDEREDRA